MKRTLALLLVAVMAITCTVAALSVSAEGDNVYTDKVNLLPNSETKISSDTKAGYSLADGRLSLTRTADSTVAWPSIKYDMAVELDLAKTPYLHMSFETSGEGDRGVNGHIDIADANDNVFQFQLSMLSGNSVDDFRDTDELYIKIDLAKAIEDYIAYYVGRGEPAPEVNFDTTGKLTIVGIELSVYGGVDETIYWNILALAKEGADDPDDDNTSTPDGDDNTSTPDDDNTSAPAGSDSTGSTSTPAESDKEPSTGDSSLLLFAVLGVVALAGVAVTVKARH